MTDWRHRLNGSSLPSHSYSSISSPGASFLSAGCMLPRSCPSVLGTRVLLLASAPTGSPISSSSTSPLLPLRIWATGCTSSGPASTPASSPLHSSSIPKRHAAVWKTWTRSSYMRDSVSPRPGALARRSSPLR